MNYDSSIALALGVSLSVEGAIGKQGVSKAGS